MSVTLLPVALSLSLAAPALPLSPRKAPAPLARIEPGTIAAGSQSRGSGPPSIVEQRRRDRIVAHLVEVEAQASEQPKTAEPSLRKALAEFADAAPLMDTDDAQEARLFALLSLSRTLMFSNQDTAAAVAMDEALTIAGADPLPVALFGPVLEKLHRQRVAHRAEQAPASLTITCNVPCRVYNHEVEIGSGTHAVPAGVMRLWIEAQAANEPVVRETFELDPEQSKTIEYTVEPPALVPDESEVPDEVVSPGDPIEPVDPPASEPAPPQRLLPRWASVVGLVAGVGIAGGGGALVAVDHRCPDLADPRRTPCPRILDTDGAGWTAVAVGGALAIASAVILVIDERRQRRARRRRAR